MTEISAQEYALANALLAENQKLEKRLAELERRLKYLADNHMIRVGDGETGAWFDAEGNVK